jgi:hypothetical protein
MSILAAALLATAQSGCAPRIRSFVVAPPSVCPGDPAPVATWSANGSLSLSVAVDPEQLDGGAASAAPDGSHLVALRLLATRNGQEAAATQWIQVFPQSFPNDIVFAADPVEGGVVAKGTKNVARWADRFEIATLAASDGRRVEVLHAGTRAVLPASGTPSAELAGTPLGGEWELTWRASDSGPAPDSLTVHAMVRCRTRTP